MSFLSRMSPVRAINDLRAYLSNRPPYELGFLAAALLITGVFIYLFARNDITPPPYKPDIVYVEQWRLDRTDAEIRAAQKIDQQVKAKRLAAEKAELEAKRAQFKKMDDALSRWGL